MILLIKNHHTVFVSLLILIFSIIQISTENYSIKHIINNDIICQEKISTINSSFIIHTNNDDYTELKFEDNKLKYLGPSKPQDNYIFTVSSNTNIILDLIVYSGDAYIISNSSISGCDYEKQDYASNERYFLSCSSLNSDEKITINFKVKTNSNNAIYLLYLQNETENSLDNNRILEMTTLESIQNYPINLNINTNNKNLNNSHIKYVTIFNIINCELIIENLLNNKIYKDEKSITDISEFKNGSNHLIPYKIKVSNYYYGDNKKCYYYVSSFCLNDTNSFMILPESKPFKFKLNKNINIIRTIFPYVFSEINNNIYLVVTLFNEVLVKITIDVCENNIYSNEIYQSTNIPILLKKQNNNLNDICQIKIIAEFKGNDTEELLLDFNIKSNNQIPYFIKSDELFSDVLNTKNTQYYMSIISHDSIGDITINFKQGSGIIFGKLINLIDPLEETGWKNEFKLPNENMTDLLNFDYEKQKLFFNKNDTVDCRKNCYLIFGVKSKDVYENYKIGYNIFFRYSDFDDIFDKYVNIKNNEYIINSLKKKQIDLYKYKILVDAYKLIIDFESEYCKMNISFDGLNFNETQIIQNYTSNNQNIIYEINKPNDNTNFKNVIIYIKIFTKFSDKLIDINKNDIFYKFKINVIENKITESIINVDTTHPVYCENSIKKGYCDFILNYDNLLPNSTIEILSVSTADDTLKIYYKLTNSSEFFNKIKNNNLNEWWPNNNDKNIQAKDYLKIPINDNNSKILLRIYSTTNSSMKLYNYISNKNFKKITPFPREHQIISVNKNESLILEIPNDNDYEVHFTSIEGEGQLLINDNKIFNMSGKFSSLLLSTIKKETNIINVKNYYKSSDKFLFYIYYFEKIFSGNTDMLTVSGGYNFINKNDFPLNYFIRITNNINDNLPINIYLNKLESIENYNETKNSISENFVIKAYLFNIIDLLKYKSNTNSKIENNFYNGSYDFTKHHLSVYIPKNDIQEFIKKNSNDSDNFIYFTIDKSSNNKRNYSFIEGKISTFIANYTKRLIPPNIYVTNMFYANNNNETIKHIYFLSGISENTEKLIMKIEFSKTSKNVNVKLINLEKNNYTEYKKNVDYKEIGKSSDFGKDIFTTIQNLSNVYLLIEAISPKNDIEYTFRYSLTKNEKIGIKYDKKVKGEKETNYSTKVKLTIDKVKYVSSNKPVNCSYYIRIFDNKSFSFDELKNSILYRKNEILKIYKINYDDELLKDEKKEFIYNISGIDAGNFIDVVAEIIEGENDYEKEFFSYERFEPKISEGKKKRIIDEFKIEVIVGIIAGILFIVIIGFCICSFIYKKKNKDLEEKVTLSFSEDKDDDSEYDDKSYI